MERVETLLKKINDLFAGGASAEQLMLPVQMLLTELQQLQSSGNSHFGNIEITALGSFNDMPKKHIEPEKEPEPEKIVEVLQVNEAEIEAELEEIKRNAEKLQQISAYNKPQIVFEDTADEITRPATETKKEINEVISNAGASLNDKHKQTKIDLGDTLTEIPIRDLKKAIGVNDRFLFINELFRGDEAMYERSIKTINSFSILAKPSIGYKES
ncbi:MAG: hypothetical protein IPP48_01405 [Chitinophagaceae bacterium]|nr:hypothetical protein [Chitinophagaceae bacterium]